jgi:hypothetical protein
MVLLFFSVHVNHLDLFLGHFFLFATPYFAITRDLPIL